jgi:hypothetical protein
MKKELSLTIKYERLENLQHWFKRQPLELWLLVISLVSAVMATLYAYSHDFIIAYGDAESHLNIAKRVVDSLTPGFAQLGGIWLPLPHLLMAPFVYFDFFWRTGLAGSIVSGISFVISCLFIYKIAYLLTRHKLTSFLAALFFIFNPNILYLQTTAMTELPLILFFILSLYYFIKFMQDRDDIYAFIMMAFFGFLATLCRYDGWFLVLAEAAVIAMLYSPFKINFKSLKENQGILKLKNIFISQVDKRLKQARQVLEGRLLFFITLAFFGILLWILWDSLILGDPLYYMHSQFSANSQQQGWLAKGQLPSYHNLISSILYYTVTSMSNVGVFIFLLALWGAIVFLKDKEHRERLYIFILLITPYLFYVITLFLGQSIIFIPHLTPTTFEWTLFNVRYGIMMLPAAVLLVAYLFYKSKPATKWLVIILFILQFGLYGVGYSKVISFEDGVRGLSTAKRPDAELWLAEHYDGGMVILDDFSRLISIIRTGIPMKDIIYVGNKPYWEESLEAPEKYADWIIVQRDDEIWDNIYEPEQMQGRLYKYFTKVYTSPEILIFKRTQSQTTASN